MDNTFKLLLFLHVGFVVVALGPTFAFPFLEGIAKGKGVGATRFVLQFEDKLERIWIWPGAILLFLAGGGMILKEEELREDMPVWLMIGIVWFLAAFATAFFVQGKNLKDGLAVLEGVPDNAAFPAAYEPIAKRTQIVGGLLGLSVVCITFLMVWQPGE